MCWMQAILFLVPASTWCRRRSTRSAQVRSRPRWAAASGSLRSVRSLLPLCLSVYHASCGCVDSFVVRSFFSPRPPRSPAVARSRRVPGPVQLREGRHPSSALVGHGQLGPLPRHALRVSGARRVRYATQRLVVLRCLHAALCPLGGDGQLAALPALRMYAPCRDCLCRSCLVCLVPLCGAGLTLCPSSGVARSRRVLGGQHIQVAAGEDVRSNGHLAALHAHARIHPGPRRVRCPVNVQGTADCPLPLIRSVLMVGW